MNITETGHHISIFIALMTFIIGILAIARPQEMSKKYGISVYGSALPYVMSTGVRDIFIGLVILILFVQNEWRLLGATHLCIGVIAFFDFFIVYKYGDKKTSYMHLCGAISVVAYGIWLLS